MNGCKDRTCDLTSRDDHPEASHREEGDGDRETALGDLKPRADIQGGPLLGIHKVPDVTLKRGSGG